MKHVKRISAPRHPALAAPDLQETLATLLQLAQVAAAFVSVLAATQQLKGAEPTTTA